MTYALPHLHLIIERIFGMRAAVKKWRNSASVRIPVAVLKAAHLDLDEPVARFRRAAPTLEPIFARRDPLTRKR
jgi:hypothetical protein